PGRPAQCAAWARQAGFEHVSLDLIYGTPGESDADWRRSLDAAVAAAPDHVLADRYAAADEILGAAGYGWYEISNWAVSQSSRCAHNMLYWTGGDWWGIGPGAHSHVGDRKSVV